MKFKCLLILPLLVASLQAASVSDLTFTLINGSTEYSVTDCNEYASGSLDIPSNYNGLPVTSIGSAAFNNCSFLKIVTIPDSVTVIADEAFQYCYQLVKLNIGKGVNFNNFNFLINTGANVKLTLNEVTALIPDITLSLRVSQYQITSRTIKSIVEEISLSSDITSIEDNFFNGFTAITSITIPDSVTSIGDNAFASCSSLSSITIGDSVTSIGDYAFRSCSSLSSIIIPDSVTSIGSYAFQSCSSLSSITIGNSVTSIGDFAFQDCTSLISVNIPDSVTSIGIYAFQSCSSLSSITIGNSVTSIGAYAFASCSSLSSIIIPDSVTSIGDNAFASCNGLTSITIGDSVTSIGSNAFASCSSLSSIIIPDSVTSIGSYAFQSCSSLENVTLNENLVSIKSNAFYNCDQLETISIPSTVRDIGTDAFDDSEELREITFEGPPPAFSITNLQAYSITPTMYYKVSPQAWMVYQSSYGLPLVYLGPPTIQVQPQNAIAAAGDSIRLSVEATDVRDTALSYQWLCNGIELSGETEATLSIDSVTQSDVGNYQVKVTNAEGNTVSEGATVTFASSGSSGDLYTQAQFDAALTSGFNLGVSSVQRNAADYGLVAEDSIEDARAGSSSIQTNNGTTTLQLQIERSDDLTNWTRSEEDLISVPVEVSTDSEYFRFAMP